MKIAFYDAHPFEKEVFDKLNKKFEIIYIDSRLKKQTASLSQGFEIVCAFANDCLNKDVLKELSDNGVKLLALRCAGFNHVDLKAASEFGIKVVRVPEYSPYAIAEHVVALIQTLNRKTHRAFNRVREGNFSINGLVGFDLHQKTIGIIGVGKIGKVLVKIMNGFGLKILLNDLRVDEEFAKKYNARFVSLDEIYKNADIISIHVPLTDKTRHFINEESLSKMKTGVMLINTGRGALIDSKSLINSLKSGQVGSAGLDVYEEEEGIFFQDLSGQVISDDVLSRLMSFPNVLITSHQGFLTHEALHNIAEITLQNIDDFICGHKLVNQVMV